MYLYKKNDKTRVVIGEIKSLVLKELAISEELFNKPYCAKPEKIQLKLAKQIICYLCVEHIESHIDRISKILNLKRQTCYNYYYNSLDLKRVKHPILIKMENIVLHSLEMMKVIEGTEIKQPYWTSRELANKSAVKINAMLGLPLREGFHIMRIYQDGGMWYLSRYLK